jgi:hypothetical protein
MSNLSEYLGTQTGAAAGAMNEIGSAIGMLADLGGAIGFVGSVVGWLGEIICSGGPDALAAAVVAITTTIISAVEHQFGVVAQLERMKEMQDLLADARTQLKAIQKAIEEKRVDPQGNPADPETASAFATALANTSTAVEKIGGGSPDVWPYWLRPFDEDAVYVYAQGLIGSVTLPSGRSVPGTEFLDPRDSQNDPLVFDYRFTLPAYLELITIRLMVLGATTPDFLKEKWATGEIDGILARLEAAHDKIVAHIVSRPIVGSGHPLLDSDQAYFVKLGAIEEYSAFAALKPWWPPPDNLVQWTNLYRFQAGEYLPCLIARYAVRNLARRKEAYSGVGLPAVFSTIDHLKQLRGISTAQWNPGASWSLREVASATGAAPGQISVRNILSLLLEGGVVREGDYGPGTGHPERWGYFEWSHTPISLREAFNR